MSDKKPADTVDVVIDRQDPWDVWVAENSQLVAAARVEFDVRKDSSFLYDERLAILQICSVIATSSPSPAQRDMLDFAVRNSRTRLKPVFNPEDLITM